MYIYIPDHSLNVNWFLYSFTYVCMYVSSPYIYICPCESHVVCVYKRISLSTYQSNVTSVPAAMPDRPDLREHRLVRGIIRRLNRLEAALGFTGFEFVALCFGLWYVCKRKPKIVSKLKNSFLRGLEPEVEKGPGVWQMWFSSRRLWASRGLRVSG